MEKYFISPLKVKGAVVDTVLEMGEQIKMEGRTYVQVSRKPRGRNILRRLKSVNGNDNFIIYS